MNISKKILIIAPHADDEVLGVGGTTHKMLSEGNEVYLLVCSKRKNDLEEYTEAMAHFTGYKWLDLQDESLEVVKGYLLKGVEDYYNEIKPDIVFIPNKDDFNSDHKAVHSVCEIVCRRYQKNSPDAILMYEVPSSTTQSFNNNFHCNYYITLKRENLTHKVGVMTYYKNEIREYPNPRSSEGILTYAKFRGMECNSEYAEGFKLIYKKL